MNSNEEPLHINGQAIEAPSRHAKIIVVDDEPDKRFLLERLLKKTFPDHPLSSFANCTAAMPTVAAFGPRIVITNGRVASQDGIEFTAFVTKELKLPVVVVSLRSELEEKAINAGAFAFIETGENRDIQEAVAAALKVAETDAHA